VNVRRNGTGLVNFKLCIVLGCNRLCWSRNYTRSKTGETSNASL